MASETELERLVVRLVMRSGHKQALDSAIRDIDVAAKDIKQAVKTMETSVGESMANVSKITRTEVREAASVIQSTRTPYENYQADIQRASNLLNKGAISQDTYNRAVKSLNNSLPQVKAQQQQVNRAVQEGAAITKRNETAQESYLRQSKRLTELSHQGAISTETYNRELSRLRQSLPSVKAKQQAAAEEQRKLNDLMNRGKSVTASVENAFERYQRGAADLQKMLDAGAISQKTYNGAIKDLKNDLPQVKQQQQEYAEAMREGANITRTVETSTERYQRRTKELQGLQHAGAITQQTYTRAIKELRNTLPSVQAKQAAANRMLERGKEVTRQAESATERYGREIRELKAVLAAGVITQQTYKRAMRQSAEQAGRSASAIAGQIRGVSRSFRSFGRTLSTFVTLPIAAAGAGFIKMASDAVETRQKFREVFGGIQSDAQRMADELDQSFGLASTEAREMLASTGDLLTGFGFSRKAALDMSNQVQKLSVDLASFSNFQGGAKRASKALTSALLGEAEAAKALGITILEENVNAQVASNAAKGMTFANDLAAKSYARLQIAIAQSKNAIGDFVRTQGSFANQFREFKADLQDTAEAFGRLLLPMAARALAVIRKGIQWVKGLSAGHKKLAIGIAAAAAAAGPLLLAVGAVGAAVAGVVSTIGTIASVGLPVIAVVTAAVAGFAIQFTAVSAAVAGIVTWLVGSDGLSKAWKTVKETMASFFRNAIGFIANFRHNISALTSWFRENWQAIIKDALRLWLHATKKMAANWGVALKTAVRLFTAFQGWVGGVLKRIFTKDMLSAVIAGIKKVFQAFLSLQNSIARLFGKLATATFKVFKRLGPALRKAIFAGLTGQSLGNIADTFFNELTSEFDKATAGMGSSLGSTLDQLGNDFAKGASNLNFADTARDIIREGAAELQNPLKGFEASVAGPQLKLDSSFSQAGKQAQQAAQQIKEAANGIQAANGMVDPAKIKAQAEAMKDGAKIAKEFQTPFETLTAKLAELRRLFKMNAIDAKTFELAASAAIKKYKQALANTPAGKLAKDVNNLTGKLREQIATFGMTSREAERWKLAQRGATAEQLKAAKVADRALTALDKQKQLFEEGKKLAEKQRTPLEKYRDEIANLQKLFNAGAIDVKTFDKAAKEAIDTFNQDVKLKVGIDGIDAVRAGSAEARRQLAEFRRTQQVDARTQALRKQAFKGLRRPSTPPQRINREGALAAVSRASQTVRQLPPSAAAPQLPKTVTRGPQQTTAQQQPRPKDDRADQHHGEIVELFRELIQATKQNQTEPANL